LQKRKIKLSAVIDEGIPILEDPMPDLKVPTALIGVAEKGYVDFHFQVEIASGHSSIPSKESSISVLRRALWRLEDKPLKPRLSPVVEKTFEAFGAKASGLKGFLLRNFSWTKYALVPLVLSKQDGLRSLLSTVCVNTVIQGGIKASVLPRKASAIVNCRIIPGETGETVLKYFRSVVDDDRVKIEINSLTHSDPTPYSPTESEEFKWLLSSIKDSFFDREKDYIIAPALFPAATDSHHLVGLTKNIYRFSPYRVFTSELSQLHGLNEQIKIDSYERALIFYRLLISKI